MNGKRMSVLRECFMRVSQEFNVPYNHVYTVYLKMMEERGSKRKKVLPEFLKKTAVKKTAVKAPKKQKTPVVKNKPLPLKKKSTSPKKSPRKSLEKKSTSPKKKSTSPVGKKKKSLLPTGKPVIKSWVYSPKSEKKQKDLSPKPPAVYDPEKYLSIDIDDSPVLDHPEPDSPVEKGSNYLSIDID